MSNAGQIALGVVGATVGFFAGGPTGAAYGLQIGLAVGTVVSPTQLPGTFGPRLNDKRTTTAQLGEPISEVFGVDVVSGTVIWLGDIVEHADTEEVGGKGAPEGENTTFRYTQPIAIGLCRGPKQGIRRIWENGKLVYDVRTQLPGESDDDLAMRIEAASTYAEGFTLYLGDETQEADPTIELKEGVGNVPGYRGLMYIVYHDRELKNDQGQRHPSFKFEIASAPIPDIRQAAEESLSHSFILRAGQSAFGGNDRGYSAIPPFSVYGTLFSSEIIGAPGVCEIVGGYTTTVRQCIFSGVVFPPVGFSFIIANYFYRLITRVEVRGPGLLGVPRVFAAPTSQNTFFSVIGASTNFEQSPTAETPFIVGEDYLVTVVSVLPAGRLSSGALTAATVAPLGGDVTGFNNFNDGIFPNFGSYTGTVDVGLVDEVAVRHLSFQASGGGAYSLSLRLQVSSSTLKLVLRFTGGNGPVICGPKTGTIGTGGYAGTTLFTWNVLPGTFVAANSYSIEIRAIDVLPFDYDPDPPMPLSAIVRTLCERCGLTGLVDVDDLDDVTVIGYKIDRLTDARSAIAVLRQIGFFDAVESGGLLKFVRRGKAAARTLTEAELAAHVYGNDSPPAVTTRSTQDVELPRQLFVQYRDPLRDYEDGQQGSPTRLITDAVNDQYIDVAVAIEGTQALQAAEILWADMWASRWQHAIALDAANADLEPTDVVLVPVDGRLERMRITSTEDAAVVLRQLSLVRDDDGSYVSEAIAEAPARTPAPFRILAATDLVLLDLPPLRSTDVDGGFYAAARPAGSGNAWPGASIFRGLPGGALSALASVTSEAVIGALSSALAAGPHTIFDDGAQIEVDLPRGQFESRPDEDLLNDGANTLAIGAHGRWELVQFGDALQTGPTSWTLSHLLRGRRGTEHNIGTALVADRVVLVSGTGILRLPLPVTDVGTDLVYRAVTIGATLSSGTDQTFASGGETITPFSPVHASSSDAGGGDLLIEWERRDRLAIEFVDPVPMSETTEAYVIEILSDASPPAVLRTLANSTTSVTYTAAQQDEDFGSPLPADISIRIYQLGALGRGHALEAIV